MLNVYFSNIGLVPVDDQITGSSLLMGTIRDKHRILQYLNREDRCRALVGQLMLDRYISGKVIRKSYGGQNIKPHNDDMFFNLSHDEEFVILVTSEEYSVGVDIMKIRLTNQNKSIDEMLRNLRSIFSHSEWKYINDGTDKLTRFYEVWTVKEAYVKCLGTGLYTEPEMLETKITESGVATIQHKGNEKPSSQFRCKVYHDAFPGYIVAICVGPPHLCDRSWISERDLLRRSCSLSESVFPDILPFEEFRI